MSKLVLCALLGLSLGTMTATAALAEDQVAIGVETEVIKDRDQVALDPQSTYLMIEAPILAMPSFIVMPADEHRAEWARQRSEALAEAIEEYPRRLASYEREHELWQSIRNNRRPAPTRPVEPTEETFPWPDIESQRLLTMGPLNRFSKSDEVSLWLNEVPPGEYIFYGFGFGPLGLPNMGTCMCMGSIRFTVEPGKITALRLGSQFLAPDGTRQMTPPPDTNSTDLWVRQVMFVERATDAIFDPRLPRDRFVHPTFRAVPDLPSWFGGMIGRVEPIPGVMSYEGGQQIDLQAAAAPAAAPAAPAPAVPEAAPTVVSEAALADTTS